MTDTVKDTISVADAEGTFRKPFASHMLDNAILSQAEGSIMEYYLYMAF